ncbi:MAG: GatB/YqeY domain-containing protein [Chloroflexota bacterium]|nr:GatB/YqeY domain-containing protein [Chloroflexota bacterium]
MSLKEQLTKDLQDAMRSGDDLKKSTIRMVRAAIKNAEIAQIGELDDAGVENVMRKEIKQRRESADEYERHNRSELAEKERAEAALIEAYLPQQMSEAEIEAEVRGIVSEVGASGPKDMNKVMPVAMSRLKGRAEGRLVNKVVTSILSEGVAQ